MYTNVDSKVRRVLFIFSFHFRVTRSFIFIIHIIFFFFPSFFSCTLCLLPSISSVPSSSIFCDSSHISALSRGLHVDGM